MIGGEVYRKIKTSEIFYNGTNLQCNIPDLQFGISRPATVATPYGIVLCAGNGDYYSCLRLSPDNAWVPFPSLTHKRFDLEMFYFDGILWAIEGKKGGVEYIEPANESQWTSISPRPTPYSTNPGCITELSNNSVIEIGGYGKEGEVSIKPYISISNSIPTSDPL